MHSGSFDHAATISANSEGGEHETVFPVLGSAGVHRGVRDALDLSEVLVSTVFTLWDDGLKKAVCCRFGLA
jgi:hypothetical protein